MEERSSESLEVVLSGSTWLARERTLVEAVGSE